MVLEIAYITCSVQIYSNLRRTIGTLPLKNERCETADVVDIFDFPLLDLSIPKDPESNFRPKTWTVPLSLETASHWAVEEKARL